MVRDGGREGNVERAFSAPGRAASRAKVRVPGSRGLSRRSTQPFCPGERFQDSGCWRTKPSARAWFSPARVVPAWSSPRMSSSSSSSASGGGQSRGRRRCSAPAAAAEAVAAAAAAAQEGAALKPMPVHAGLLGSGEGGGAGAVAGPGPWLRHGPGNTPRFLFFLLQASVEDGPPPPPQQAARRRRSESAAAATRSKSITVVGDSGREERGRREDTKTVSECRDQPGERERPGRGQRGLSGRGVRAWTYRRGTSPCEQQRAARISALWPERSINLSSALPPRPTLHPPIRAAPCPQAAPLSSFPIGCERASAGPSPPLSGLKASAPVLPPASRLPPAVCNSSSASAGCGSFFRLPGRPPSCSVFLSLLYPLPLFTVSLLPSRTADSHSPSCWSYKGTALNLPSN